MIPGDATVQQIVAVHNKWIVCANADGSGWASRVDALVVLNRPLYDGSRYLDVVYASATEPPGEGAALMGAESHEGFFGVFEAATEEDAIAKARDHAGWPRP